MSNMFSNGVANPIQAPITPDSQVVIPQITIPSGFRQYVSKTSNPSITQITVQGKEAAKNYKLPPNSRVAIFDENEPVFYFKETDDSGNEIAFKTCSYTEIEDPPEPEYLTVQEFRSTFEEFAKSLKEELLNGQSIRTQSGKHREDE